MRRLTFLILFLGSTVYGQVGVRSDSSRAGVLIQLKIDTADWQWEISIVNNIPDSYIKLYQPGLESFTSSFTLYDSSLREITSRCMIIDHFVQGKLYSRSQAKKIPVDSTFGMTTVVDTKKISPGYYYSLDKYFCRIRPDNLIRFVYSTPVIVYSKQNGNEMGRFNLMFSTAKMKVSQSSILADSTNFPFIPN